MDYIIYFVLDCLDTLAVVFLMLSIFQYPIREYLREIITICLILAGASLIDREIINNNSLFDFFLHLIFLVYGLRIFLKVKLYRSFQIVGVGAIGYFAIQMLVVAVSTKFGIVDVAHLEMTSSWASRYIQLTSQAFAYLLAYFIVVFNLGVAKFIRPPHDFYLDKKMTKEKRNVLITSSVSLAALSALFYIYMIEIKVFAAAALANILFIIVVIFTYRRDTNSERDNSNLPFYFRKD